jgi:hypothetical protein
LDRYFDAVLVGEVYMTIEEELAKLFSEIKLRVYDLDHVTHRQLRLLAHIRSLTCWEQDAMDYPEVIAEFPETIDIAWAVCHPECGVREFIVEGSTQECQSCGSSLFRLETRKYRLINE